MENTSEPQLNKHEVSRSVTPYDYGYNDEQKWNALYACKSAYKKSIKLDALDRLRFSELNDIIGSIVDFTIGKKTYKATIIAVSLPDETVTLYPTGEIHEATGKEFASKYCSYPYEFNLSIKNRLNFWTSKIENLDISSVLSMPKTHFKFKDLHSIPDNFM
jgi:hypothetical protein